MSNQLAIIEQKLNSPAVTQDLMLALDLQPGEEEAIREAKKYTGSVLMEIKRTEGSGNYTDLTTASPDSIVRAMIDAAKFKLQIDGRKLCYLEKRGNAVGLQINANGFVAKIKESYPDATFVITPVFKGDPAPSIKQHPDGNKSCEFTSTNVFADASALTGILVQISYTDHGGKQVQDVQAVPVADLKKMQAQSKSKAWGTYTIERMKTAALKRATKWHFRQNATLQQLVDFDNEQNYHAEPATPVRNSIIDNINSGNAPQESQQANETPHQDIEPEKTEETPQQQENGIIDADFIDVEPEQYDPEVEQELVAAGDAASSNGVAAYKDWIATLSESQKDIVRSNHQAWQAKAKEVTAAQQQPPANEPPADNDAPPI